ncbi:MAG: hypothetical protein ABW169_04690 [Sphingobium sp.]
MIHSSVVHADRVSGAFPATMVMAATRCWRDARDRGIPVQPALHALLAPTGYELLGPAFDSLMRLCESRLDRALCTGCRLAPSDDEHLICALLTDPTLIDRMGSCGAANAMDRPFTCALQSARIMLQMLQPC